MLELSGIDYSNDFALGLPIINVEQMERPIEKLQQSVADFIGLQFGLTFLFLKNAALFAPSGSHEKGSGEYEKEI